MTYLLLALAAAATWALVILIDKNLVSNHINNDETLVFTSALFGAVLALILGIPFTIDVSHSPIRFVMLAAIGVLYFLPTYAYFKALRMADATAVGPMIHLSKVTTVVLAFVVLGEVFSGLTYLGLAFIIGGVFAISVVDSSKDSMFKPTPAFWLMVVATPLWSVETILMKIILRDTSFWTVYFWQMVFGVLFTLLLVGYSSEARSEMRGLVSWNRIKPLSFIGATEILNAVGVLFLIIALSIGPASIVSSVSSVTPLFIFAITLGFLAIGRGVDDENIGRATLTKKGILIAIVVIGLVLVSFS